MNTSRFGLVAGFVLLCGGLSACGSGDSAVLNVTGPDGVEGVASNYASQTIDSSGGSLSTAVSEFEVPAGNFVNAVTVSLSTTSGSEVVELGGSSYSFPGQGKLTIDVPAGQNPEDYEVFEYQPLSGNWTPLGGQRSDSAISIWTDHTASFKLDPIDHDNN